MLTDLPERVQNKILPEPNSGCWLWVGAIRHGDGYGSAYNPKKKYPGVAHKIVYKILKGEVPEGLDLDHLCRVRSCVNPDHLEPVTRKVNVNRGKHSERLYKRNASITHCPKGHEYSGNNLLVYTKIKRGKLCQIRRCRICNTQQAKDSYHRVKQRKQHETLD